MSYQDNVVVVLTDSNGKPYNESNGRKYFLPYDKEFKIRIKNKDIRRLLVKIDIDGRNVCDGLVINAHGDFNLERFLTSGDSLGSGQKFKTASSKHDPNVADPTSCENGEVVVEYWHEVGPKITYKTGKSPWGHHLGHESLWPSGSIGQSGLTAGNISMVTQDATVQCLTSQALESSALPTVEGGYSDQSFTTTNFEKDHSTYGRMVLQIRHRETTDICHQKCKECGSRHPDEKNHRCHGENYCTICGRKMI